MRTRRARRSRGLRDLVCLHGRLDRIARTMLRSQRRLPASGATSSSSRCSSAGLIERAKLTSCSASVIVWPAAFEASQLPSAFAERLERRVASSSDGRQQARIVRAVAKRAGESALKRVARRRTQGGRRRARVFLHRWQAPPLISDSQVCRHRSPPANSDRVPHHAHQARLKDCAARRDARRALHARATRRLR